VRKIKIILVFVCACIANNVCYAICNEGEEKMNFYADAFKGHAVFVWKEISNYSFAWLPGKNALTPRKSVSNAQKISECIVIERMKKMKGLKQTIFLFLIEDPHSYNFINKNHNPMASKDDFVDLLDRLEMLAKDNQISFRVYDSQRFKSIPEGF
jgi:hypothetical protein